MILREILSELTLIRKELQDIRKCLEFSTTLKSETISQAAQKAIHGISAKGED